MPVNSVDKLRQLAFAIGLIAIAGAIALAQLLGIRWDVSGYLYEATLVTLLVYAGLAFRRRGNPLIGDASSISAVMLLAACVGGSLATMSALSPFPLADRMLFVADAALGMSAPRTTVASASWPAWAIDALRLAYTWSAQWILVTVALCLALKRREQAWHVAILFSITIVVASAISILFPAYGSYVFVDSNDIKTLPSEAGRYAWERFDSLRSATDPVLSVETRGPFVTFPSFHTICALLPIPAWWSIRGMREFSVSFAFLIIVSTIPMGGHYFVDLAAGAGLWAFTLWVLRRWQAASGQWPQTSAIEQYDISTDPVQPVSTPVPSLPSRIPA
jgi:hypothetical protein